MFRIIRIEVEREALIDAGKTSRSTVERLHELVDLTSSNGVFYTVAMATTSTKYFEVESCLRSLFGDSGASAKWQVIDYSSVYVLIRTKAPKDYDYGYCVDAGQVAGESGTERLVAVPQDKVAYQSGRYESGMFMPVACG